MLRFTCSSVVSRAVVLLALNTYGILIQNSLAETAAAQSAEPTPLLSESWAEIRLPWPDLRTLMLRQENLSAKVPSTQVPPVQALLTQAQFDIHWPDTVPVAKLSARAENLGQTWQVLPLLGDTPALLSIDPIDARLVPKDGALCLLMPPGSVQNVQLRFTLPHDGKHYRLAIPNCPVCPVTLDGWAPGDGVLVMMDQQENLLTTPSALPIATTCRQLLLEKRSAQAIQRASAPPQPSEWNWQQHVVIIPDEGELDFIVFARASANTGSGITAELNLPAEARNITFTGDDLVSKDILRNTDGKHIANIVWRTRDILDRKLTIRFRLPVNPLDKEWLLPSPISLSPSGTRVRYHIAESPILNYQAQGLSEAVEPMTLHKTLQEALAGRTCQILDSNGPVRISLAKKQIAKTADTLLTQADWQTHVESDGAVLHEGELRVVHNTPSKLIVRLPADTRLLSCTVNNQTVHPTEPEPGSLEIPLSSVEKNGTKVHLSLTGKTNAIHPVEGTLAFSLPEIREFIQALKWSIHLPMGYQAETHGNVQRSQSDAPNSRHILQLVKNLCRDEVPTVSIFYQHAAIHNSL